MNNQEYKHYKGGIYLVIGIGKHTENREELVAYCDSDGVVHFRPHEMFFGTVVIDGKEVRRFEQVKK